MFSFLNSWFSMDYEGQRRAEKIFQVIIALSAVIGFVVGFVFQLFSYSVFTLAGGCVLSCLICLFNWPWFHLKSLNWQKPLEPSAQGDTKKTK